MSLNTFAMIGRLTRDPEKSVTPQGKSVCQFSIAVSHGGRDDSSFFDCQAWERTADAITEYFHKGNKIGITGYAKQERWQDKTSGQWRSKVKFIVTTFDFCEKKADAEPIKKDDEPQSANAEPYHDPTYDLDFTDLKEDIPF
jgi:single-strand DNA-binding protein